MSELRGLALVTGARGAVGRYVSRALAEDGWTVQGLGNGAWDAAEARAWGVTSWHEGPVSLERLCGLGIAPAIVVHCAGSGSVGGSFADPYEDYSRTVTTTAAVLEFMRSTSPEGVLVYPSSAAVYGVADRLPIQEDAPRRPASPYGAHKCCAEDLVLSYAKFLGVKASIVRLFSIYGEGFRKQLLWDACRRTVSGETVFIGQGSETRDFLHASDAAKLILVAASRAGADCPIVNGGSGRSIAVRDALGSVFSLLGRQDAPEFAGSRRPGDPHDYRADTARAHAWGWQPMVDWNSGLARYVEWFRKDQQIDQVSATLLQSADKSGVA